MNTFDKRFENMLESLLNQCVIGDAQYRMWEKINEALEKYPNVWDEYPTFFNFTTTIYYESFVLCLCRLIDTSGQAISVDKILKYGKKNLGIFAYLDKKSMEKIIDDDFKSLKKEQALIDKILGQRNYYFAHLSGKYLSSLHYKVFEDFSVPDKEMHDLLKKITDILNHLNYNFRREKRILVVRNQNVECADQTFSLIQKLHEAL